MRVQRCTSCGSHWFPDRLACPECGELSFEHVEVVEAAVEETTLLRRAPGGALDEPVPLATVRLDVGPHVVVRVGADARPGDVVALD